jgi:hypothetical protein
MILIQNEVNCTVSLLIVYYIFTNFIIVQINSTSYYIHNILSLTSIYGYTVCHNFYTVI